MKSINKIPFDQLKVGDHVVSAIGNLGVITELYNSYKYKIPDDPENLVVSFTWSNGKSSRAAQWCYLERVWYVGPPEMSPFTYTGTKGEPNV